MASQIEPWIAGRLLSLGNNQITEYDGEYCQITRWCNKRDPLDVEGEVTAIISDRDIQIPLKIPHEVACDVEKYLGYELISEIRLPCIAIVQRFTLEPYSANPCWGLVTRGLAIQGGHGEPVFGKPSWYLDHPKLMNWRPAFASDQRCVTTKQHDSPALPSVNSKLQSPLKLAPQDRHQEDKASSSRPAPVSKSTKRTGPEFGSYPRRLRPVNFFEAFNLLNASATGTPTKAEGTFEPESPTTSEAQSHGAQYESPPSRDQSIQDIIRSLPEGAEIDADPHLLSPGISTLDVDDGLDFESGDLGTDSDTGNGSPGPSPLARNPETMEGEGRADPSSPCSKPNRTPTPLIISSASSSSSSDDGANGVHTEMEWEPSPRRPRLESRTFSGGTPSENEPDELASQDGCAVLSSHSVTPDPSSEQTPANTQPSNLPRILVPSSDPSSISLRVHVTPESEPRIQSTPASRPNNTSIDVRMETPTPDQTPYALERSAKRRSLTPPEETKSASPGEQVHRQAHNDSPSATPLSQPSEPRSPRQSASHSGSGRSERLVPRNGGYAFGIGKARRPGSSRPSFTANLSSGDEPTGNARDESGSELEDQARPAVSKARINDIPQKPRKSEADVFLSTPRPYIPVLSVHPSRFSLLHRSPSPPYAITSSPKKRRTIPTSTGAASTSVSRHFPPADMLTKTCHEDVSDANDVVHRRSTDNASSSNSRDMSLRPRPSLNEADVHNHGSAVQYRAQMETNDIFNVSRPHRTLSGRAIVPTPADTNDNDRRRLSIIPGKRSPPPPVPQPISRRRHLNSNSVDDVPVINFRLSKKRSRSSLESSTKRASSDFDFGNSSNNLPIITRSNSSTSTMDHPPIHSRSQSRNAPPHGRNSDVFGSSSMSSLPLINKDPISRVHNDNNSRQRAIAGAATTSNRAAPMPNTTRQPGLVSLVRPHNSTSSSVQIPFAPPYTRGYLTTAECIEIIRRANELRRTAQARGLHLRHRRE